MGVCHWLNYMYCQAVRWSNLGLLVLGNSQLDLGLFECRKVFLGIVFFKRTAHGCNLIIA